MPDGGGDHLGLLYAIPEGMKQPSAIEMRVGSNFKITTIKELLVGLCAGQCNGWDKWLAGFAPQILFYNPWNLKAGDFRKTALPASHT